MLFDLALIEAAEPDVEPPEGSLSKIDSGWERLIGFLHCLPLRRLIRCGVVGRPKS